MSDPTFTMEFSGPVDDGKFAFAALPAAGFVVTYLHRPEIGAEMPEEAWISVRPRSSAVSESDALAGAQAALEGTRFRLRTHGVTIAAGPVWTLRVHANGDILHFFASSDAAAEAEAARICKFLNISRDAVTVEAPPER